MDEKTLVDSSVLETKRAERTAEDAERLQVAAQLAALQKAWDAASDKERAAFLAAIGVTSF